ncbi:MAG: hypothetical protein O7G28_10740 [Deltaproteobacteria bacterium]|nr:hypothetical protein [Deltaproteobacteria bacterium]
MAHYRLAKYSSIDELVLSSLATADTLAIFLIEKELVTEAEFMQKLSAERARYQAIFKRLPFAVVHVKSEGI